MPAATNRSTATSRSERRSTSPTATRIAAFPRRWPRAAPGRPSTRSPVAARSRAAATASRSRTPRAARAARRAEPLPHPAPRQSGRPRPRKRPRRASETVRRPRADRSACPRLDASPKCERGYAGASFASAFGLVSSSRRVSTREVAEEKAAITLLRGGKKPWQPPRRVGAARRSTSASNRPGDVKQ